MTCWAAAGEAIAAANTATAPKSLKCDMTLLRVARSGIRVEHRDRRIARSNKREGSGRAVVPGLAALFFGQMNAVDAHAALNRLDHVIDRQAGDRHRGQRLHLDAGRAENLYGRADDTARQFF